MELKTYARTLWQRWPLLVLFALLAAVAAYSYSAKAPPTYRATAELSVTPSIVDYWTGEAVGRLLNNYSARLRSKAFAAEFAPALNATADDVAGKVHAVASTSDFRITIEVEDASPARAQAIANAAAARFVETIRQETAGRDKQDIYLDVMQPAERPSTPIGPRPKRDALGAALAGAVVGALVAFLLAFWDDTVQDAEEAATLFGVPVLGAIPRTSLTGVPYGLSRLWPFRSTRSLRPVHPAGPTGRRRVYKSPLAGI